MDHLNKKAVLAKHQGGRASYRNKVPGDHCFPVKIEDAATIKLADLNVDHRHEGKSVRGVLCADPIRLFDVAQSVLEDEDGSAILVQVGNAVSVFTPNADELTKVLPKGALIVIRDPHLIRGYPFKGTKALWVPNPGSLQIVTYFPRGISFKKKSPKDVLKAMGNDEYGNGNYRVAVELYTKAIEAFQGDISNRVEDMRLGNKLSRDQTNLMLVFSNRAQCWLYLGNFSKALEDADASLKLDGNHGKSIGRKVVALCGLKKYRLAHECVAGGKSELEETKMVASVLKDQSESGNHSLSEFYASGARRSRVPQVADFVDGVEIRTSDDWGRGLFLTKNVRKGDLILVSNAVTSVDSKREDGNGALDALDDLAVKVISACRISPRILAQVMSLPEHGRVDKPVPSMELFKPNYTEDVPESEMVVSEMDVTRIKVIVHSLHAAWDNNFDNGVPWNSGSPCSMRLWTLPSFINHSCLPNVCIRMVGDALYVFAGKDMQADTELVACYGADPLTGYSTRAKDFTSLLVKMSGCRCLRCKLEKRMQNILRGFETQEANAKMEAQLGRQATMATAFMTLTYKLEDFVSEMATREQQWLRASFSFVYCNYYHLTNMLGWQLRPGMPSLQSFVRACHEVGPGAPRNMSFLTMFDGVGDVLREEMTAGYGHLSRPARDELLRIFRGAARQ